MLRSHPRQKLRLKTTTAARMVGTKLVATSARVTLARMEEVPKKLRSTVLSVINKVALQTPITPMTAAFTRQTVVGRDSLVDCGEKKSNHAFVQLEKKLEKAEKKLTKMSKKMDRLTIKRSKEESESDSDA